MPSSLGCIISSALLSLGAASGKWPVKTVDPSDRGAKCDTSREQYLRIKAFDYHDHPRVTMTWRQLTGPCGTSVSDAKYWTATYDSSSNDHGPPRDGKVELELMVCCPYGQYELELDVKSYCDKNGRPEKRIAWRIENGYDGYIMWDTDDTDLTYDEDYCPKAPGVYTWPLRGETGYYKEFYAGPFPPVECEDKKPHDTEYVGCYSDSSSMRVFREGKQVMKKGRDGMTNEHCSVRCKDYDFFGTENGDECYCGNMDEVEGAEPSDKCGMTPDCLCAGDAGQPCGGRGALSVYRRKGVRWPHDDGKGHGDDGGKDHGDDGGKDHVDDGGKDHGGDGGKDHGGDGGKDQGGDGGKDHGDDGGKDHGDDGGKDHGDDGGKDHGDDGGKDQGGDGGKDQGGDGGKDQGGDGGKDQGGDGGKDQGGDGKGHGGGDGGWGHLRTSYKEEGCFVDTGRNRIMTKKTTGRPMSAEICFNTCNNGRYTHFGTQFGDECWCGEKPHLTANGEEVSSKQCHMRCTGPKTEEKCGGYDRMSAYKMTFGEEESSYVGCYGDDQTRRAMPDAGKYTKHGMMTNEVCRAHCSKKGYKYAGTSYAKECWCSDSYDYHGLCDECDYCCEGDRKQMCGGYNALSVYKV